MAEEPDSLVLALLREIRGRLDAIDGRMGEIEGKIDDLRTGQNGQTGVLMALAGYIRDIDLRVEHLEERIGGGS